jgi:GNAT superfamily N-acetyltransferase
MSFMLNNNVPFHVQLANLSDASSRAKLSVALQEMETVFTYPLGDAEFVIRHGAEGNDYFTFFEQFGEPNVFLVYAAQTNELVGVGCAVLREIEGTKVWYLGDFKVLKAYRGKGVLSFIMKRYFLKFYSKAGKMIAVNMSAPEKNGLVSKLKSLFSLFSLSVAPLYFYEWSASQVPARLKSYTVVHNRNRKDIVIGGEVYPLYHLCEPNYFASTLTKVQSIAWEDLPENAVLMYCGTAAKVRSLGLELNDANNVGSLIRYGIEAENFCSVEI